MKDVIKGFTGTFTSGKALGGVLAVVVILAALYAFVPAATPEAIATKVRG